MLAYFCLFAVGLWLIQRLGPALAWRALRRCPGLQGRFGPGPRVRVHLGAPMETMTGSVMGLLGDDLRLIAASLASSTLALPPRERGCLLTYCTTLPLNVSRDQVCVGECTLPARPLHFVEHEGTPMVLRLTATDGEFELGYPQGRAEAAVSLRELLLRRCLKETRLRGRLLFLNQGHALRSSLQARAQGALQIVEDDRLPVLDAGTREQLEESLLFYMRERQRMRDHNVSTRRGVLLNGPPGTGKTSLVRWLVSQAPEYVALSLQSDNAARIHEAFQLARELAPSLVVLEDVDLLAVDRYKSNLSVFLGALMTELDGLESNEDVVVVMTSNDSREMEQAMIRRPGRVDSIIEVGLPDQEARRAILERLARQGKVAGTPCWERVARASEGLSPAALGELYKQGLVKALRRSGPPQLETGDFLQALPRLREQLKPAPSRIGLRPSA